MAAARWNERRQRVIKWRERKPGTYFSPEYETVMLDFRDKPPGFAEGQDPILARLLWMEWWIDWALSNCKSPTMVNR